MFFPDIISNTVVNADDLAPAQDGLRLSAKTYIFSGVPERIRLPGNGGARSRVHVAPYGGAPSPGLLKQPSKVIPLVCVTVRLLCDQS